MVMLGAYGISLDDVSPRDRFVIDGLEIGEKPLYVGKGGIDVDNMDVARSVDVDRPSRHGNFAVGQDLLTARKITIPYVIAVEGIDRDDNVEQSGALLNELERAWRPRNTDVEVFVQTRDRAYVGLGRPRKMSRPRTQQRAGVIQGVLLFVCGDPILYSAAEPDVAGCPIATVGTGMGFPMGFPFGFGSGPTGCALVNSGTADTWPQVTITAGSTGIANPTIIDRNSGLTFSLTGTLGAGWSYVIDMQAGQVLLTNNPADPSVGAARNNLVARPGSDWLPIPAGGTSWQFGCGSGDGFATVTSRAAYY